MNTEALKIGDVVADKWIYCETASKEPFLVAPRDSGVKKWQNAMNFAARYSCSLPNIAQLAAMHEACNTGAFKNTFNQNASDAASLYWSSDPCGPFFRWCQGFAGQGRGGETLYAKASVRVVRPYSIA